MRVKASVAMLLVLAAALVAAFSAGAKPVPPLEGDVRFAISCPNFTTPVLFEPIGLVDLYIRATWTSKVDQDSGVMRTTMEAAGLDGGGRAYTVSAKFELQGLFFNGVWLFPPGEYGTGRIKVTRADGAKAIGEGFFVFAGSSYGAFVAIESGKCVQT